MSQMVVFKVITVLVLITVMTNAQSTKNKTTKRPGVECADPTIPENVFNQQCDSTFCDRFATRPRWGARWANNFAEGLAIMAKWHGSFTRECKNESTYITLRKEGDKHLNLNIWWPSSTQWLVFNKHNTMKLRAIPSIQRLMDAKTLFELRIEHMK